jgi:hypothetical protein
MQGNQLNHIHPHGAEPFLRSRQLCSPSRTSQHFMETESWIPCSQEPSNGPYPEPYQSNLHHPMLCLLRSILILSTHLRLGLLSGLFSSGFYNILYEFLFSAIRVACPANLLLLELIILIYTWRRVQHNGYCTTCLALTNSACCTQRTFMNCLEIPIISLKWRRDVFCREEIN